MQLAVFNAVSETPLGQNIGQRLAEYGEVLGEQVANAMEGEKINKDDNTGAYLIGCGVLTAGILTGMLVSGKSVAKSRTISAEMKADPYHLDWKTLPGLIGVLERMLLKVVVRRKAVLEKLRNHPPDLVTKKILQVGHLSMRLR
ncbi:MULTISPECIES: hypothetical protein [Pseudomonas]|uniref:hypothetical protein n=1 Tax=Pseudomonas TaxID=286 RepID=UPI000F3D004F|nr:MULTISPECIES: hypothetical protein [Pseudomonas]MCK9694874.1 hypothetical protein [Pseudomonas syringae pv. syringae]MCK9780122.1 hypothetical protein [Pseudomonas syringae pv. syringae]MDU8599945.1 hypothetical protein [Pseudomonas syringae]RMS22756.1 Adhesin/filamentous hemagglutinin, ShlA/HecA/FhaA family [Pseudomonas syringae pv. aceris]RXF61814.1 hypothetical protein BKM77_26175 [Pseudomonas syringae]